MQLIAWNIPKKSLKTFCHSDVCSIRKLWAFTGHYLLIFSIIANKDAIKFVIFTKNLSNSRRKMVIAKARPSIGYCHSSTFVNLWMRLLYLCVILELIEKTLGQGLYRNSKVEFNTFLWKLIAFTGVKIALSNNDEIIIS